MKRKIAKYSMHPVQVRFSTEQIEKIDSFVKRGIYPNRSEAVRDAVRKMVFK